MEYELLAVSWCAVIFYCLSTLNC